MTISIQKFLGGSRAYDVEADFEIPILAPGGTRVQEINPIDPRPPTFYDGECTSWVTDEREGANPWLNPSNMLSSDDAYADSQSLTSISGGTWWLIGTDVTAFDSIPGGRGDPDGMSVFLEGHSDTGFVTIDIGLFKEDDVNDVLGFTKDASLPTGSPGNDTIITFGGASDKWGAGPSQGELTLANIKAPDFGLRITASYNGDLMDPASTGYLDHAILRAHYDQTPLTPFKGHLPDATLWQLGHGGRGGGPVLKLLNVAAIPFEVWDHSESTLVGTLEGGEIGELLLTDRSDPNGRWHMRVRTFT